MIKLEPVILSPGSLFKEKIKWVTRALISFFKKISWSIINFFISIKDSISSAVNTFYYNYHNRIDAFKKSLLKLFYKFDLLLGILIILLYVVDYILINTNGSSSINDIPLYLLKILGITILSEAIGFILLVSFLKWYHYNIGEESNYEINRMYSKDFVVNLCPNIGKIWGITGKGKDELAAGLSTHKIEGFKEKIQFRMHEIKQICYIFDFNHIERVVNNNMNLFFSSSDKVTKNNFHILCKKENFFIHKAYKKSVNIENLIHDYKIILKNRVDYTSKYIHDEGGINKKHYLEMLYEYIMLYVRQIEGHFLFANHPMIEDLDTGTPAAKFSQNYMIINNAPKTIQNEKDEDGNILSFELTEKVLFPFKNYLGIIETEADSWYMNISGPVKKTILDLGLRDFKAYNRHFFQDLFMYQISQDPSRTSILFRELEHAYLYPDTRTVYKGAKLINKPLLRKINKLNKKKNKIENIYISGLNNRSKNLERIFKYAKFYEVSNKQKYKNKIDSLKDRSIMYDLKMKVKKYEEAISSLYSEIAINEYNHGYVTKIVTISRSPATAGENTVYSPKDIIRNPDITKGTYSVKLTFKLSDCWKYNTHYMEAIKTNRSSASELNLIDVKVWDKDLIFKKDDVKDLGYVQAAKLFGMEEKEITEQRFNKKKL